MAEQTSTIVQCVIDHEPESFDDGMHRGTPFEYETTDAGNEWGALAQETISAAETCVVDGAFDAGE